MRFNFYTHSNHYKICFSVFSCFCGACRTSSGNSRGLSEKKIAAGNEPKDLSREVFRKSIPSSHVSGKKIVVGKGLSDKVSPPEIAGGPFTQEEEALLAFCQEVMEENVNVLDCMSKKVRNASVKDRTEIFKAFAILIRGLNSPPEVELEGEVFRHSKTLNHFEWRDGCTRLLKIPKGKRLEAAEAVLPLCHYMFFDEILRLARSLPNLSKEEVIQLMPLVERRGVIGFSLDILRPFIAFAHQHGHLQKMVELLAICPRFFDNGVDFRPLGTLTGALHNRGEELLNLLPMLVEIFSLPSYRQLNGSALAQVVPLVYKLCEKEYLSKEQKISLSEMLPPLGNAALQEGSGVSLPEFTWEEKYENGMTINYNSVGVVIATIGTVLDENPRYDYLRDVLDFYSRYYPLWVENKS